ncbi:MAG: AI-2E family transporter, partial [Deltaproteobacteria bacterium]
MAPEDGKKRTDSDTNGESPVQRGSRLQRNWLLVLVAAATLLFLWIVAPFLKALFVAVVLAAISYPIFDRMVSRWRLSAPLAAGITTVLVLLFVLVPAVLFLAVLVSQAISVGSSAGTWIQQMIQQPGKFQGWLQDLPFGQYLVPYQQEILAQASKA